MLSTQEKKSYFEDGFVIPDFRLDQETLAQILSDHDRLLKKHPEFLNYCPNVLAHYLYPSFSASRLFWKPVGVS